MLFASVISIQTIKGMTFAATESAIALGQVGQRRRRHRHSATGENDGEDVLSPLIVIPTPRMSKPIFSSNSACAPNASNVGSTHTPSPSLSSPYSFNSQPPRISSTRSQIEHLGGHHLQTHNQFKIGDDDDSKSKTSFLSEASKKLKKKLAAKKGRKSWHGEGWRDHHRDTGNDDDENEKNGLVTDYNTTVDIPFFEDGNGRYSNTRTKKEARDPSPTHEYGDDDEYYNSYSDRPDRQGQNHRSRRHCGHHDFKEEATAAEEEEEEDDDDDGEYTHNDGSTLSTNSTPACPTPLRKHVYVVRVPSSQDEGMEKKNIEKYCDNINETFKLQSAWLRTDDNKQEKKTNQRQRPQPNRKGRNQQQHQQEREKQQQHQHHHHHHRRRRDHSPLSPLDIVVASSRPQSPGGKCVEESPKHSGKVKCDEVQEVPGSMIRQLHGTDLENQCRMPREVVTNNC